MSGFETVAIAASAAGTALSAVSAIQQGNAMAAAAKYNAQLAERDAQIARQQAAADEEKQRRLGYLRQGEMRTAYGASGVSVEGSPLDMLEQSAAQEELDALTIRYRGEVSAIGREGEAALYRSQASAARTQGYLKAGSSILLGGAQTYDMGQRYGLWGQPSPTPKPPSKSE